MNFCNKNVFFSKKYAIFIYVNVSEGSFDLFAQFQAPFYEFNEINETIGTVRNGFGVLGVYSEVSHSNS